MDKWQALQNFWGSFKWPAYDENSVPEGASFPRITYEAKTDSLDEILMLSASLWDKSTSWENISKKADEIAEKIVNMNPPAIKLNEGRLFITKGAPFAQRLADTDNSIKRIYLNIRVEFFTSN